MRIGAQELNSPRKDRTIPVHAAPTKAPRGDPIIIIIIIVKNLDAAPTRALVTNKSSRHGD